MTGQTCLASGLEHTLPASPELRQPLLGSVSLHVTVVVLSREHRPHVPGQTCSARWSWHRLCANREWRGQLVNGDRQKACAISEWRVLCECCAHSGELCAHFVNVAPYP